MAVGFDLAAADIALSLREEFPDISVVAVIPFEGMHHRFPAEQRTLFERVAAEADEVITLATHYSVEVYTVRNNFLVDNSSACIAYFDGSKGGTAYTVRRAVKSLSLVVNIYNKDKAHFAGNEVFFRASSFLVG